MIKLGRNDPCHCGSGQKYKKCCLEKDERGHVTRIVPSPEPGTPSAAGGGIQGGVDPNDPDTWGADTILGMIDTLPWANDQYPDLARLMVDKMTNRYDWGIIAQAVTLLHGYTSKRNPTFRNPGVLPAAAEYCLASYAHGLSTTQAEVARIYEVSAATIAKKAQDMLDFIQKHMEPLDGSTYVEELHREQGITESALETIVGTLAPEAYDFNVAGARNPQREPAMRLIEQARTETTPNRRIELARQAIELYPDAYNLLAEHAQAPEQILEQFRRGLVAGERDLGAAYIEENRGHFWGLIETRPYMRAKAGYAEACLYLGRYKEAARHYEDLLELNPNDNQGVRDMLAAAYLELKQYDKAADLLERFGEDTASVRYDRLLIEYGRCGVSGKLPELLREAKRSNPHVIPYLTGKKQAPSSLPESYRPGEDSEAQDYIVTRLNTWRKHAPLVQWVADQA
ncbi:SEC-C metal-binding domain-containing protein [Paenibacillus chartarius]|uniref:SEC-C metal-binding domain-containing protein n=1 Tax=Paenibacillus chartarius TaxID=747481 RepID=A0ABV6DGA9_9BACL